MAIYIWNLFGIIIWYIFLNNTTRDLKKREKNLLFLATIQFVLIAGLRNVSVGADTKNYLSIYRWICVIKQNG